jgi:peptide/nickel transport system ATP-binding protein
MKQRVVIAIALSCEPDLLIADEPTTALDVTIQAQVLAMMGELRDRLGTAMILITHDLGVVAQICDKVAVMYAGELIEEGTLEDIYVSKDHHPYTIGLFGALPNLVVETDRLAPIAGLMPDPSRLPVGCNFQDRCPQCMDICKEKKPDVYINGKHMIECYLFSNNETWRIDHGK